MGGNAEYDGSSSSSHRGPIGCDPVDTPKGIDINLKVDEFGLFFGACAACGAQITDRPVQPKVFAGHALFHRDQKHGGRQHPDPSPSPSS